MTAFLGTRSVRHIARCGPSDTPYMGRWTPLCWSWGRKPVDAQWLGNNPTWAQQATNGNHRRGLLARWAKPVCTRCLRELAEMQQLVDQDLVRRADEAMAAARLALTDGV